MKTSIAGDDLIQALHCRVAERSENIAGDTSFEAAAPTEQHENVVETFRSRKANPIEIGTFHDPKLRNLG